VKIAQEITLLGVYIPKFDKISVKFSVLGVLYSYRCTDGYFTKFSVTQSSNRMGRCTRSALIS